VRSRKARLAFLAYRRSNKSKQAKANKNKSKQNSFRLLAFIFSNQDISMG
jgi:hypothetical protein